MFFGSFGEPKRTAKSRKEACKKQRENRTPTKRDNPHGGARPAGCAGPPGGGGGLKPSGRIPRIYAAKFPATIPCNIPACVEFLFWILARSSTPAGCGGLVNRFAHSAGPGFRVENQSKVAPGMCELFPKSTPENVQN